MKLTLDWLKNYVDTGSLTPEELAEHLTMLGLEVDSVTPLFRELADLKTGLVVSTEKHPDADKLTICQVLIGDDTHQIVCGAPNVRKGLAVVVALPGVILPGNLKIKKTKIRGVASGGMICSERELGLSNDHDGIMELSEGTAHGQFFIDAMGLSDIGVEVDLTPNRPDCASVIGIAREVSSITRKELKLPVSGAEITTESNTFEVEIHNPELCPRYAGRLIENVKVGPSPWWLRKRLLSVGLRPINNIVDITNFVMLEYGQPLHAFDFDRLAGGKIVVRTPTAEEGNFTTLDGNERKLEENMLLICDEKKPVAIAGVMGGMNSEVETSSTRILLESACFNAVSIRKTARRLNLSTDSSYRFERGVDPKGTINALNRAVDLICELAGGMAAPEGIDRFPGKQQLAQLPLNISRANRLLGLDLSQSEIIDLLESIELRCQIVDTDKLKVTVPAFRVDLEREADLVEEIARLYGYNNIPTTLPAVNLSFPEKDNHRLKRLKITRALPSIGFSEAINYSFTSVADIRALGLEENDPRTKTVNLLNPLSEDQAVMRTMLLPGLLGNVRRNINFQKSAIKLFELGKVFTPVAKANQQPVERHFLGGVLSGNRFGDISSPLHYKHDEVDIYDTKGAVEFIFSRLALPITTDETAIHFSIPEDLCCEPFVDEGHFLSVYNGGQLLGSLGRVTEKVLKHFSIKNRVYYFELDFDALCALKGQTKQFCSLPVFPSVTRDIALVVPDSTPAGDLLDSVCTFKDKLIEDVKIFDVFKGKKTGEGFKSVALTITYRSQTKTLTEKNVEKSHSKVVRMLTDRFGGSFRNE